MVLEILTPGDEIDGAGDTVRHLLDIVVAGILLIPALPLILLLGLFVKLDSPGPVLYAARRMGQGGRIFRMYKLRTMSVTQNQTDVGPPITLMDDRRVTKFGRLLRRARLDELPQLINVVKGDMSLVGPRPEDPAFLPYLDESNRRILHFRPGITGPTQLKFRNESAMFPLDNAVEHYARDIMPQKIALDLDYQKNRKLSTDLRIILSTVAILFHRGAEPR